MVIGVCFANLHTNAKQGVVNVLDLRFASEISQEHVRQTQPGGSDQLRQDQAEEDGDAGEKSSALQRE